MVYSSNREQRPCRPAVLDATIPYTSVHLTMTPQLYEILYYHSLPYMIQTHTHTILYCPILYRPQSAVPYNKLSYHTKLFHTHQTILSYPSYHVTPYTNLGSLSEKNTGFFGSFSHTGRGGLTKSQNFCDLTK